MRRIVAAGAAAVAMAGLASCSTVAENRIESALTDAGLSQPVAECIAGRMVDRLSWDQLRALGRLSEGSQNKNMSLAEFLRHYQAALDPERVDSPEWFGLYTAHRRRR